jgi:ferritin
MKLFRTLILVLTGASFALAQKEFLTPDEIEKIREAQEPNERLKVYLQFAKQRMDQLNQLVAKEKKGRSITIRDVLDQYVQIIDAIDTVSDDALKRKKDIALGAGNVSGAERGFLGTLQKIQKAQPQDIDMYEITLKEAIAITEDSLAQSEQDLDRRATSLADKAEDEKRRMEAIMTTQQKKEQAAEAAKTDAPKNADGSRRKPPTLYKPGEKPGEPASGGGTKK